MSADPGRAPPEARTLAIDVRFLDGRYHGVPEWPPAPGRLMQALVAGAGPGISPAEEAALRWFEGLEPPVVCAPPATRGEQVKMYVPNNDLDAKGGDPDELATIRTAKWVQPYLFDPTVPLRYLWSVPPAEVGHAAAVCELALRVYQLGRGVDMACAQGAVLDGPPDPASYPGQTFHPSAGPGGTVLACPTPGSYASLVARHVASSRRFEVEGTGKQATRVFVQPPKPRFAQVTYEGARARRLFELRPEGRHTTFAVCPLTGASPFVQQIRDAAAERLGRAVPTLAEEIERALIGRGPGASKDHRIRIVPIPSIGHRHADRGVRRVLVEVPSGAPLAAEDVFWAFSGLQVTIADTVVSLTPGSDHEMLDHFGVGARWRTWRTVTAAVLPESAKRRRIEPTRQLADAKGGAERENEQAAASAAVLQALRHAGVGARVASVQVQREPFDGNGGRAELFSPGTRFVKERLWHVEVAFAEPVTGPVVIGDGRFLGLGVMAPVRLGDGVFAFAIEGGLTDPSHPEEVGDALRRAVMARVQQEVGPQQLEAYFTGHAAGGGPARREAESHLYFALDPQRRRLLVVAPHLVEHRPMRWEEGGMLRTLGASLAGLRELRAGRAGLLALAPEPVDAASDLLLSASRRWESATPYLVTRHGKRVGPEEVLRADVMAECERIGLPLPQEVTVLSARGIAGVGLQGRLRLEFAVAVEGPLWLGRNRHRGGGLFQRSGEDR